MANSKAIRSDRAILEQLRDRLDSKIRAAENPYVVASLAPQLVRTIAALSELKKPAASRVDEVAAQRVARRRAAGFTE